MPENEVIKNGICYMCTASCAMKIHVNNGKATKIDWAMPGPVSACPRWRSQLGLYLPSRPSKISSKA